MKVPHFLLLSSLVIIVTAQPLSYQKVQFVIGDKNPSSNTKSVRGKLPSLTRNSRSFGNPWFTSTLDTFWPIDNGFLQHPFTIYDLSIERGHITPDFSNGLDYPDPLLLTGKDAILAVKYLYGRGELFFHQIPHIRALLRNQEERRINGLTGNYLSSSRPGSPFYRH